MNKWLYFVGGLALGAVGGILGYRFYLLKTYEDPGEEEDLSGYERFDDEEEVTVNPPMTDEEKEEIKERLEKNYEETTNYAAMYQGDAANHEHPLDDDEEEEYADADDEFYSLEETKRRQENKGKKPKIISMEAVADLPATVDMETLLYYTENDVLTTDTDEEIDDPGFYLGDALTKYGFVDNIEEECIWVMNYAMDTCYEVQKVNGYFEGSE